MKAAVPGGLEPNRESIAILSGVDLRYLNVAFAAIDRQYGSFEHYRSEALGLSNQDVEDLRKALLTPKDFSY